MASEPGGARDRGLGAASLIPHRLRDRHEEYGVSDGGGIPSGLEPVPFLDATSARGFLHALCSADDRNLAVLRRVAVERLGSFSASGIPERELLGALAEDLCCGGWAVLRKKRPELAVAIGIAGRKIETGDFPAGEPTHRLLIKVIDDDTGKPVDACRLDVSQSGGAKQRLQTRPDGIAELPGAKPGGWDAEGPFGGLTLAATLVPAEGAKKSGKDKDKPPPPAAMAGWTIAEVEAQKVKRGDTLTTFAQKAGMSTVQLAYFNFGVYEPEQIEEALRNEVGCTHRNKDGKYVLDDSDEPGLIYVPKAWTKRGLDVDVENVVRVKRIVRKLPDFKIWLQIDVHAENAKDDKVILETEDGTWKHELEVKSLSEPEPGYVEAIFPSPPAGHRFHLLQDYNDGGELHHMFESLSWGDLREALAGQVEDEERFRDAQSASG